MMKHTKLTGMLLSLIVVAALALTATGCTQKQAAQTQERDDIAQLSTLTALVSGDFYGSMTVNDLMSHGDFGLGCFNAVDGEMIVVDGVCYQALGDGSVRKADPNETVPFATLCKFNDDFAKKTGDCANLDALKKSLDTAVAEHSKNGMYAVKIHTKYPTIHVRSETKQKEPYQPLDKALETSQTEFNYKDVSGTLVCFYFPDYMSKLNSSGWHVHFISDDGTKGGHVLDVSLKDTNAHFDEASEFTMLVPDTESFKKAGINNVGQDSIDKAEKK